MLKKKEIENKNKSQNQNIFHKNSSTESLLGMIYKIYKHVS